MCSWTGLRSKSVILNMDFHKYISGHVCMYVYNDFYTLGGMCVQRLQKHMCTRTFLDWHNCYPA